MITVAGQSNETIVLGGEWFEKLRGAEPETHVPASSFISVRTREVERRKKLSGGEKETLFLATFRFESGPFVGFAASADRRPEAVEIISSLEEARGGS